MKRQGKIKYVPVSIIVPNKTLVVYLDAIYRIIGIGQDYYELESLDKKYPNQQISTKFDLKIIIIEYQEEVCTHLPCQQYPEGLFEKGEIKEIPLKYSHWERIVGKNVNNVNFLVEEKTGLGHLFGIRGYNGREKKLPSVPSEKREKLNEGITRSKKTEVKTGHLFTLLLPIAKIGEQVITPDKLICKIIYVDRENRTADLLVLDGTKDIVVRPFNQLNTIAIRSGEEVFILKKSQWSAAVRSGELNSEDSIEFFIFENVKEGRYGRVLPKKNNVANKIQTLYKKLQECPLKEHLRSWFELSDNTTSAEIFKKQDVIDLCSKAIDDTISSTTALIGLKIKIDKQDWLNKHI